jgi:hypothetical protein
MKALNVLEPLRVKVQAVKSATEASSMILRIDDVVASKGMKGGPPPGGGMGGMGGGMGGMGGGRLLAASIFFSSPPLAESHS